MTSDPVEAPAPTPPGALADALRRPAWALIRLPGAQDIALLGGVRRDVALLRDVPLEAGPLEPERRFDRLLCVPFAQIRERGFEVHDDDTPLSCIEIDVQGSLPLSAFDSWVGGSSPRMSAGGGFVTTDDDYARLVGRVIRDEIGNGEGANLVIARDFLAKLEGWDDEAALGVFARLLRQERGAYWTFLVFTGDRYLLGASPERHIRVQAGEVSMNPISGTFRLGDAGPGGTLEQRLLDFLRDEKEIFELFMVVDEELKMMCGMCSDGGSVLGPTLLPMSHLVHTEYQLQGRTSLDVRDVLRDSMFAATVTGSPVENACRLIKRYESAGRGYYGSVLALLGRDAHGEPTVDAPIILRTADVSLEGQLRVTAGATLVRDSVPWSEVAETHAKAAGILSAFGLVPGASSPPADVAALVSDPVVTTALATRNERLSRFWLSDQGGLVPTAEFEGRRVVVLDGEDDFVAMLRHMLRVLGMHTVSVRHGDYLPGDFDGADLVIVGPGPGDPRDVTDPKMATIRAVVDTLLGSGQPFLAVCLGHQVLCGALGLELGFKDIVFQGTQTRVDILGRQELVGFYNTFVARVGADAVLPEGVTVDADATTGDVHLLRGSHFVGIQFHTESILTEHGFDLLRELVRSLLTTKHAPAAGDGWTAGA